MITDFFLGLWMDISMWVLVLMGEYDGLPVEVEDGVAGVSGFFASSSSFLGALDHWFPVAPFLAIAGVSLLVEGGIVLIRGFRQLKQLLPFQ